MAFLLGDVVRLKSGGPKMTFSELNKDGYAVCVGFSLWQEPFECQYEPEALELADDESEGFYDDGYLTGHEDDDEDSLSDEELDLLVAQSQYYKRDRGH